MKFFAMFGALALFASVSWSVDCAPQSSSSRVSWTSTNGGSPTEYRETKNNGQIERTINGRRVDDWGSNDQLAGGTNMNMNMNQDIGTGRRNNPRSWKNIITQFYPKSFLGRILPPTRPPRNSFGDYWSNQKSKELNCIKIPQCFVNFKPFLI